MSLLILAKCDQINDVVTAPEEKIDNIGLPIDEDAIDLPVISDEHPLDERAMLEKGLEKQRDLYKLGFVSNDFKHLKTDIVYYPLDDTFGYSSAYQVPNNQTFFKFEAGTSFESSLYDSMMDSFVEPNEIQHETLQMMYGEYIEEATGDYYIIAKEDDLTYIMQTGSKDEGYTEEIMEKIGATFRSENDGAFDPFYQHFSLDLSKIKFPKMNEDRVAIHDTKVSVHETAASEIQITYMLSEQDTIEYQINDTKTSLKDEYKEVDTSRILKDLNVTEYKSNENDNHHLFHWTDEDYEYTLAVTLQNEDIIENEEIYEIIESATQDERSFEHKEIFDAINEMPKRTKAEKSLTKLLKNINKDSE